jgi:ribosomal protein L37E
VSDERSFYECPDCKRVSYNVHDVRYRYCVVCGFADVRALRRELAGVIADERRKRQAAARR